MPKNISDKQKTGNKIDYSNNSGLSYYNNSINSKKKNSHKSNEHFEKEKKAVSYKNIFNYIL